MFCQAAEVCTRNKMCVAILFIDECDALFSSDVLAGMLSVLLDLASSHEDGWQRVVVVGATNSVESIPKYLRRPGRFDLELKVPPPSAAERTSILASLIDQTPSFAIPETDCLRATAEKCVGYVAADLVALIRRAVALALDGHNESIGPSLEAAMTDVGASALRKSSSFVLGTRWADIAGDPGGALVKLEKCALLCLGKSLTQIPFHTTTEIVAPEY